MTAFQSEDAFAELYYSKFVGISFLMRTSDRVRCESTYQNFYRTVSSNFTLWIVAGGEACNRSDAYVLEGMFLFIIRSSNASYYRWKRLQPPFGDVDDRIRAIATGLGLRTILWQYDSQDWQVGTTPDFVPDMVDKEYQAMIDDANKGMFDTVGFFIRLLIMHLLTIFLFEVGTMILMHELNEFTMTQAMKYYPKLKAAFQVGRMPPFSIYALMWISIFSISYLSPLVLILPVRMLKTTAHSRRLPNVSPLTPKA